MRVLRPLALFCSCTLVALLVAHGCAQQKAAVQSDMSQAGRVAPVDAATATNLQKPGKPIHYFPATKAAPVFRSPEEWEKGVTTDEILNDKPSKRAPPQQAPSPQQAAPPQQAK